MRNERQAGSRGGAGAREFLWADQSVAIRRDLQSKGIFTAAFTAVLVALAFLRLPIPVPITPIFDYARLIGPLIALYWCFSGIPGPKVDRSERNAAARREPWLRVPLFLGAGTLAYLAGMASWLAYGFTHHARIPHGTVTEAVFLLAYPFFYAAVCQLPSRPLPLAQRGRVLLDSMMIMTATVTFSWFFLLGPAILRSNQSGMGKLLGIAFPFCDLVLLLCLLSLSTQASEPKRRRVVYLLCLSFAVIIAADTVHAFQMLHGNHQQASWPDAGWPLGFLLIGLSARAARRDLHLAGNEPARLPEAATGNDLTAQPMAHLWRTLLPYALVPATGILLLYTQSNTHDMALFYGVFIGSVVIVVLVMSRQIIAIWENRDLNRQLQRVNQQLEEESQRVQTYAENQVRLNEDLMAMQKEMELQNQHLLELNQRLESLATTDGMTGLANHRVFQQRLRAEIVRARYQDGPLAVILLDVDHFKQYNDTFGHPAGDQVLAGVAQLLRESVRAGDLTARYGGEEFAVILPETDGDEALAIAERIRTAVESCDFAHRAITVSVGVTNRTLVGDDPETLIESADQALYTAKRTGRNRVVAHGAPAARLVA